MTDSKGREIAIGDRVLYTQDRKPALGTVRAFSNKILGKPAARVDDGNPNNPDHKTNGLTKSAWIECKKLEVTK